MGLQRRIDPEWLDQLPASDPRAVRSRRDLKRINALLSHTGMIYEAEVVWVAYAQRGLRFIGAYTSADKVPPWLEPYRRQTAVAARG